MGGSGIRWINNHLIRYVKAGTSEASLALPGLSSRWSSGEKRALGTREMRGARRTRREVTLWSNADDLSVAPGGPGGSVGGSPPPYLVLRIPGGAAAPEVLRAV